MYSRAVALTIALLSAAVLAQDAVHDIPGLFGECSPIFASTQSSLTVYLEPDLRSQSRSVPYGENWEIPYDDGHTRVLQLGSARARKEVPLDDCPVKPDQTDPIRAGQKVEYLFYVGEGYGRVRIAGGQCVVPIHEEFGFFVLESLPEVQTWIRAKYADGTSPGWVPLLNVEIRVAGIRC